MIDSTKVKLYDMPTMISIEVNNKRESFILCGDDKRKIRSFVTSLVQEHLNNSAHL